MSKPDSPSRPDAGKDAAEGAAAAEGGAEAYARWLQHMQRTRGRHAAITRNQRKDMARRDDVVIAFGRIDRDSDGVGAVMR